MGVLGGLSVAVCQNSKIKNGPSSHKIVSSNIFDESHLKDIRLQENLMPSGRYLFIPFLRTKNQICQAKNR